MCVLFALFIPFQLDAIAAQSSSLLRVQFSSEPTQYDPLFLEDGPSLKVAANTIGTLYEYDGKGELQKSLVSDVVISKDQKHYTFKFKNNLKWSDGKPFHADQFILAIQRLVNEPVKAALSELFPAIDLSQTKAIDAVTAEVVLREKDGQLLKWLSLPPFAPIRSDMIETYRKKPTPVVPTLAAYQVMEHKREDFLSLKKNPNYYGKNEVAIEEVKIQFIKDEAPLLTLLKQGRIDILGRIPVLQVNEIKKIATVYNVPVEAVTYLGLNVRKPPFNDRKNRQKLRDALSLKKFALVEMLKTEEIPALFFIPSMLAELQGGYASSSKLDLKNTRPAIFTAQSDVGSRNQTILEWAQSEVKRQIGWTMKLDLLNWKAHYGKLKVEPAEVFRFGWQNPVSSPYVMYQVLQSKSVNNYTGWSNESYDRLVDDLKNELDSKKRQKLIEKIEAILAEEVPVVPVLHQVLRFAISKRVEGFRANPFGVILFRELHLALNSSGD